jgi:hypothetical protein
MKRPNSFVYQDQIIKLHFKFIRIRKKYFRSKPRAAGPWPGWDRPLQAAVPAQPSSSLPALSSFSLPVWRLQAGPPSTPRRQTMARARSACRGWARRRVENLGPQLAHGECMRRETTHLCIAAHWRGKMAAVFGCSVGDHFLYVKTLCWPIFGFGSCW